MAAVAVSQEAQMDRIDELIIAGEPKLAKELWLQVKQSVNGRKNQLYRLDCIRMRVESVIRQFELSADPRVRQLGATLQTNLQKFLQS